MRQVREILRLISVGDVPIREIARRTGAAPSTIRATIERIAAANLSWPLPEGLSDSEVVGEARRAVLFKRNDDMLEILPKGVMHFPAQHQR